MKHFIYKTTHTNGKYYIGRHSTENLDDGYIGSGLWPLSIKDKTTLIREILEYANDDISLKLLEERYLLEHFGNEGCMNQTTDSVGFSSQNNPMKDPDIVAKISGDNHWLRKNPERGEEISKRQLEKVASGTHPLQGDRNPNKDGRNAKAAMKNGKHVWLANNPNIWRLAQGIHQWQNGNAPNFEGRQNKRLVEEGTHNFLGPEQNKKRVEAGTHNFMGSAANLKRLSEGTHPSQRKATCEHCQKTVSIGMYKRWHGDNCKQKETK
jgi:hypothetical protein